MNQISNIRKRALELARKRVTQKKKEAEQIEKTEQKQTKKKEPSLLEKKKLKEKAERQKEREKLAQAQNNLEKKIELEKVKKIRQEAADVKKKQQQKLKREAEIRQYKIDEEQRKKDTEKKKRLDRERELLEKSKDPNGSVSHPIPKISKIPIKSTEQKRERISKKETIAIRKQSTSDIIKIKPMKNKPFNKDFTINDLNFIGNIETEDFINDSFINRNIDRVSFYVSNSDKNTRLEREKSILREKEEELNRKLNNDTEIGLIGSNEIPVTSGIGVNFIKKLRSFKHLFLSNNFARLIIYRDYQISLFKDKHQDSISVWPPLMHSNLISLIKAFDVLKYKNKWVSLRSTVHILELEDIELKSVMSDLLLLALAEFDPERNAIKISALGEHFDNSNENKELSNYIISYMATEKVMSALIFRIYTSNKKYPADSGDLGKIIEKIYGNLNSIELKRIETSFFSYLNNLGLSKYTKKKSYGGGSTRFVYLTKKGVLLAEKILLKNSISQNESRLFYHTNIQSNSNSLYCPSCKRTILSSFNICPYCSHSLQNVCIRCKSVIQPNWKVCPICSAIAYNVC